MNDQDNVDKNARVALAFWLPVLAELQLPDVFSDGDVETLNKTASRLAYATAEAMNVEKWNPSE